MTDKTCIFILISVFLTNFLAFINEMQYHRMAYVWNYV